MKIFKNRDTQLHAFAIWAVGITLIYLSVPFWLVVPGQVAFALLWELKDLLLIRKDFGSRASEVKYNWADIADFAWGIGATAIVILLRNIL